MITGLLVQKGRTSLFSFQSPSEDCCQTKWGAVLNRTAPFLYVRLFTDCRFSFWQLPCSQPNSLLYFLFFYGVYKVHYINSLQGRIKILTPFGSWLFIGYNLSFPLLQCIVGIIFILLMSGNIGASVQAICSTIEIGSGCLLIRQFMK